MRAAAAWSVVALLGALTWSAPALAERFTLETVPVSSRLSAMAVQQSAVDAGIQARVVRRAELHEVQFVLVVDGFDERAAAESVAEQLAEVTGLGVSLLVVDEGLDAASTDEGVAADAGTADAEAVEGEAPPSADEILLRAARSLGGRDGGLVALEARGALFVRYERAVYAEAEPVRVRHEWLARGEERHLTTQILEGEGSDSEVWIGAGEAWVSAGGAPVARPLERAAEVIERYAPTRLLAWPLTLPDRLSSEARADTPVQVTELDGRRCLLVGGDDALSQIWVEPEEWRVLQVRLQSPGGEVRYVLGDWREIAPQIVVPFHMEIWRDGETIEALHLEVFELDPEVPEGAFSPPEDT